MARLTVATCQFPVAADVERNGRHVMRQMRSARERGADLAHFPEACLSGYAGSDFDSYDGFDWAQLDCAAMIDALPQPPLYWIGHSLGGQILALVPNKHSVAKAVTVATGSGYWLENVPSLRLKVWWLWYVLTPIALRVCGYFPGRALRKVGDLPKGVMAQWRRWCLDPEYAVGAVRSYGILRGLVLAAWRLLRCNPWSHGGVDFVEDQTLFRPRAQ